MINVLIADNSPIVRRGLKHIAEETPDIAITAEASNRDELLEKARADGCNIAVIDLAIPGIDGPRFLKELQQEHPGLPVLVLSDHPEDEYALRALRAGASGYITKESSSDQLVGAIRTVTQGGEHGLLPPVHARLSRNVRVGQQHRLIYIRDPASEA